MISGYTITRDCISHDYCVEECIRSMLPFCEEVVVGDAMSKDGTRELLEQLARETGKIRIVDYPRREDIFNEVDFVCKWMNFTRERLLFPYQLYLDADEIVGPDSGSSLTDGVKHGAALACKRLNFWKDTKTLVPSGVCLSDNVVRTGPSKMWMPMDGPTSPRDGECESIKVQSSIKIFHYGFLRKQDAFARKAAFFLPALIGMKDDRIQKAVDDGVDWMDACPFKETMGSYTGPHPDIAVPWLRARGYKPLLAHNSIHRK